MAQGHQRTSTSPGLGPVPRGSTLPPPTGRGGSLYLAIPRVVQSSRELAHAPLDHRHGFVLSLIDGRTSVAVLIDLAGIPAHEVIEMIDRMRFLGILGFD